MGNSASRIGDTPAEPLSPAPAPVAPAASATAPPEEPPEVLLTEYAKRYGKSTNKVHEGTGKSGITPLSPPSDLTALSTGERLLWREYDIYQRQSMRGFTSWELMDSGAITKADVKCDGLAGSSIHTFYKRERWQTRDVIDIGEGIEGIYEASNDVVWSAILPSLHLASLIWTSARQLSWLDTILYGQRIKIPSEEIKDGGPNTTLYSLHSRAPEQVDYNFATASGFMEYIAEVLTFSISSGVLGDESVGVSSIHGITSHQNDDNGHWESSHIRLSWQDVIILLRSDTTVSERLVQQFIVANTLVHEVCHAIEAFAVDVHRRNGLCEPLKPGERATEPFYQDEEMTEMGWANEQFLWGGNVGPIVTRFNSTRDKIRPPLALRRSNWPNWKDHYQAGVIRRPRTRRFRRPENFGAGSLKLIWPVSIFWLEEIQTKDFWTVAVTKFGSPLTPPAIMGRMDLKESDKYDPQCKLNLHSLVIGPEYREWAKNNHITGIRTVQLPDKPFADAADEQRWQAEYDTKMGAIAVNVASNLKPRIKKSLVKKGDGAGAYIMAKEAQLPFLAAKYTKYGQGRARVGERGGRRGRGRGSKTVSSQGNGRGSGKGRARGK